MKTLTAFLITVLVCTLALGQTSSGKITGTVKDPDGAIMSGVDVSLISSNRAVLGATVTDAEGRFTLENVAPGDYQLNIERTGFLRHRSAVHVTHGNTEVVNIVLE